MSSSKKLIAKINQDPPKAGVHLSLSGGVKSMKATMDKIDANCVQFFARSPRNYRAKDMKVSESDGEILRGICSYIHAPYGSQLTGSDVKTVSKNMAIVADIKFGVQYGCRGVVIHPGTRKGNNDLEDYEMLYRNILYICKKCKGLGGKYKILLENTAKTKKSKALIASCSDMISVYNYIRNKSKKVAKRVAFCIDTCHLFVTCKTIKEEFNGNAIFKNMIEDNSIPIGLIHLNDATVETRDLHADIFSGIIPPQELINIITCSSKYSIPMIIERYKPEEEDIVERWARQMADIKKILI